MSKQSSKSVQFASSLEENGTHVASAGQRPTKRARLESSFPDEDEDLEAWTEEEASEKDVGIPSEKDLIHAKRRRRLQRQVEDFDDDDDAEDTENWTKETYVNDHTSLMAETDDTDIPIEPFNMNAESTDGTGYFEGDTYVFRKVKEVEADAWLDSLDSADKSVQIARPKEKMEVENEMDQWTKEELYASILPLVSDTETILQAVVRYGNLIKKRQSNHEASAMAHQALDTISLASNALLLQGDVDIYQKTRNDIMKLVPEPSHPRPQTIPPSPQPSNSTTPVLWEYKGNQDGNIHGPFSTQNMIEWTKAGYFVGDQAVQIRSVIMMNNNAKKPCKEEPSQVTSTAEDLLSDLMEEDCDENNDTSKQQECQKGEWVSSNDVDFMAYTSLSVTSSIIKKENL
jgi:GYF domain